MLMLSGMALTFFATPSARLGTHVEHTPDHLPV
jgi:hypothetical protein